MLDLLENALNTQTLTMLLAAIAAAATVLTLAMPLVFADPLDKRMKAVALEREKMRQRERERMALEKQKVSLRQSPKAYVQTIVDRFNLTQMGRPGRGAAEAGAGRLSRPGALRHLSVLPHGDAGGGFLFAAFYLFVVLHLKQTATVKFGICIAAAYLGMHLPLMILKSKIQKRQLSIKRAFPDTLDLLLICVESGMSIEAAFKKVSEEIGTQSVALAEELTLTMAELSYLPDRRQAYENLAKRTDLEGVKSVCMALQQAERYGTPLATMLRTMAQENRDMRMSEAEKKAAGLPPKLTVPMILFFLPVLFVVILGPAAIKVMGVMH